MTDDSDTQSMPPAPDSPSPRGLGSDRSNRPSRSDPAAEPDVRPDGPPDERSGGSSLPARIARAHRQYLQDQSELERNFLRLRREAAEQLLEGGTVDLPDGAPADDPPDSATEPAPVDPFDALEPGEVDPPAVECTVDSFDRDRLEAFASGEPFECFGAGWERTASQVEPPRPSVEQPPVDRIEVFEPVDGPEGAGYVRASREPSGERTRRPMALRRLGNFLGSFYLAGCGDTLGRDGLSFELAEWEVCERSQSIPALGEDSRSSRHELEARSTPHPRSQSIPALAAPTDHCCEFLVLHHCADPEPALEALLTVSSEGERVAAARMRLELVPDWPLDRHPEWRTDSPSTRVASHDGVDYDENATLACALGRLSEGLGEGYGRFDGSDRTARLPGPPFQFVSRIVDADAEPGDLSAGACATAEYDLPERSWPVDEAGTDRLPFSATVEVGLQPCGWLSVFGLRPDFDGERFFRNLDGTCTVHAPVPSDANMLRTDVELTSISRPGDMVLVTYEVEIRADETPVLEMETVFGFFTEGALARQEGLPSEDRPPPDDRFGDTHIELDDRPAEWFEGPARLPGEMLSMLDEVTGWNPDGGEAGLGRARAEAEVDPEAWYFRAHFLRDPVQPGSLGIEAMVQLLQWTMLRRDLDDELHRPRFEPVEPGREVDWTYRGQVRPEDGRIAVELEITELGEDEEEHYALARGSLWVDDLRIYEVQNLGTRLVADEPDRARPERLTVLDPETDEWLRDHRPTYTRPALPMMAAADQMAITAARHTGLPAVEVRDVQLEDWILVDEPTALGVEIAAGSGPGWYDLVVTDRDAMPGPGSPPPTAAARGRVRCAAEWPDPPERFDPIDAPRPMESPYETGRVFHGPAFRLLRRAQMGARGASGVADAGAGDVPEGRLHPALLDTALHIIPHDRLQRWSSRADADSVAFPHRLERLQLYGPAPTEGEVAVETRFRGFEGAAARFPLFDIQLVVDGRPWAEYRLVGMTFPQGSLGRADPGPRRRFMRDREFVPDLGLSTFDGDRTRTSAGDLQTYSWFDRLVADLYAVDGDLRERTRRVAVEDHAAQRLEIHPSKVEIVSESPDGATVRAPTDGITELRLDVRKDGPLTFVVTDASS
ncbi:MAG: polyketide synthase dehydratase domain-containing protein [Bradymonadaceae bacterium]